MIYLFFFYQIGFRYGEQKQRTAVFSLQKRNTFIKSFFYYFYCNNSVNPKSISLFTMKSLFPDFLRNIFHYFIMPQLFHYSSTVSLLISHLKVADPLPSTPRSIVTHFRKSLIELQNSNWGRNSRFLLHQSSKLLIRTFFFVNGQSLRLFAWESIQCTQGEIE